MNKIKLKYFDILAAKQAFLEVKNITEHLRKQKNTTHNDPDIIEIAYDLQAGSYIEAVEKDPNRSALYTAELADILDHHISQQDSILDIGTGELTTLSLLAQKLKHKPAHILAFDMSWSRVYKGLSFAKKVMGSDYQRVIPFVADISEIPLCDKSINVTISS